MKHRHRHRHPAAPAVLAAPAQATASNPPVRAGWTKLGSAAVVVWYLGGFVLLFVSALLQVGPFAWAAAWQIHHWGTDSVILSFLPGFAVLAAPIVLLRLLPYRPDHSFLAGAQDALSSRGDRPIPPPSPERMARLLLRMVRIGLALSLLFLIAGGAGYVLVRDIGDRGAGTPLPELTLAAATGRGLPSYARIAGVVRHPDAGWVHDHTVRQTRYHDLYLPLTGPGWQPGDAVTLLEEESTVMGDSPATPSIGSAGPIEGQAGAGSAAGLDGPRNYAAPALRWSTIPWCCFAAI